MSMFRRSGGLDDLAKFLTASTSRKGDDVIRKTWLAFSASTSRRYARLKQEGMPHNFSRSMQGTQNCRLYCACAAHRRDCHRMPEDAAKTQAGISDQVQPIQAIEGLNLLVQRGFYVPISLFYKVLRTSSKRNILAGQALSDLVLRAGFESNRFLANHFICMYASHGRLQEAWQVFIAILAPDSYMWSSIILAHADHRQPQEAIRLYWKMRQSSVFPDNHIFAAVLKACVNGADLASGRHVHADVLSSVVEPDVYVGSCLVDMYGKCGRLEDARRVFDHMTTKNLVTWTAMIAGYARHGLGQEALAVYASMEDEGFTVADSFMFASLFQACASIGDVHQGKEFHSEIKRRGLEVDVVVGSSLVDMYARCGALDDARQVFDSLGTRDVVTWNAMIAGYAQHGLAQEALAVYATMQEEGISQADEATFLCLLKACGSIQALHQGKQLHLQVQESGLESDVGIGNGLIDMYVKCGSVDDARVVFDNLAGKDVLTWTAMLAGYTQHGLGEEALALYAGMEQQSPVVADQAIFVCLLKACAGLGAMHHGERLHVQVQENGLEADVVVGSCLVDMYTKCGSLIDARSVFDKMATKNVVTWNVMLGGYVEAGFGHEALALYARMQQEGTTTPTHVTFACLLRACGSVGAFLVGKALHSQIRERGLEANAVVGSSLVDMYAKCGSLDDAQCVFENLPVKNVVTWSAMIAGYGQHGLGQEALLCYEEMLLAGVKPNGVTFLLLLSACNHAGLVDRGSEYFESMSRKHDIQPEIEHYVSMIDMLGRAGRFCTLERLLSTMPMEPDLASWLCVLSSCRKHGNVLLGERAFACALRCEPSHSSAYALMAQIYASAGLVDQAKKVGTLRDVNCCRKERAQTWIEHELGTKTFWVGDGGHGQHEQLYDVLEKITERMNFRTMPIDRHACQK